MLSKTDSKPLCQETGMKTKFPGQLEKDSSPGNKRVPKRETAGSKVWFLTMPWNGRREPAGSGLTKWFKNALTQAGLCTDPRATFPNLTWYWHCQRVWLCKSPAAPRGMVSSPRQDSVALDASLAPSAGLGSLSCRPELSLQPLSFWESPGPPV